MWHQIVTAAEPIIVSAAVAVITAVIGVVGAAATKWLGVKKAAIVQKIGVDAYNQKLNFARQVWAMVDETWRITPTLEKTFAAKQEAFAAGMEKLVPGITATEIETLRQTVAGEINAGKAALNAPAVEPAAESEQSATDTTAQAPAAAVGAAQ